MNLRALRYFVAIVDAGSLSAAAKAVAIAQPALSRQMHELERDLGVVLLQRTARGVRMTPDGATLYPAAQRLLADVQRVRAQLAGPRSPDEMEVVLGASPTLSRVLVPGVFERCQRSVAGVHLTVREAFTPVLLDWLEKGMIDVALVTNTPTNAGRAFAMQALLGEPFALVTRKTRKLAPLVTVGQLARVPVLMTTLHRTIVEDELRPLGLKLKVQAEIDSVDTIRELVLQGPWSTVMPISVFQQARAQGKLTLSQISGVQLTRQLLMATRIERHESAALAVIKELVAAELARLMRNGLFSFAAPPAARSRGGSAEGAGP